VPPHSRLANLSFAEYLVTHDNSRLIPLTYETGARPTIRSAALGDFEMLSRCAMLSGPIRGELFTPGQSFGLLSTARNKRDHVNQTGQLGSGERHLGA
jgi:hypothetical protein